MLTGFLVGWTSKNNDASVNGSLPPPPPSISGPTLRFVFSGPGSEAYDSDGKPIVVWKFRDKESLVKSYETIREEIDSSCVYHVVPHHVKP